MTGGASRLCLVLAAASAVGPRPASGQVLPDRPASARPDAGGSVLGPSPGAGGSPGDVPGENQGLLGGRPGVAAPLISPSAAQPGGGFERRPARGIAPPTVLGSEEVPMLGPLEVPSDEDLGPPGSLTLDQAVERLVRENLDLKTRAFEIPEAEADVLTAGLRANPILYADTIYIPYQRFDTQRPGGPTQYDLSITHPFDLSGKRRARTAVACRAKRVVEAQYQDAVRLEIANLSTAWVDILSARASLRYSEASLAGLGRMLETSRDLRRRGLRSESDVNLIRVQHDAAEINLRDARGELARARRNLALLLNVPPGEARALEIRGSIRDPASGLPPLDDLVGAALAARPDLAAYRLGVERARSDVALAEADRYGDVYLLYGPYIYQYDLPFGTKNATSFSFAMTVPLPIYNRNQGNIRRARINVAQTKTGLSALERRVVAEVEQAAEQYDLTRAAVEQIRGTLLPTIRQVRDRAYELYTRGEGGVFAYFDAQREYNEVVRQYRDGLVRHRRSMLDLNTAVGLRLLP